MGVGVGGGRILNLKTLHYIRAMCGRPPFSHTSEPGCDTCRTDTWRFVLFQSFLCQWSFNSEKELRESASPLPQFGMNMITFIQRSTAALLWSPFAPLWVLTSSTTLLFSSY